ncbi:MAG: hypothetical protein AAFP97_00715 [Pseudomonadota bacterium]
MRHIGLIALGSAALMGCETVLPHAKKPQAARLAEAPDAALRDLIRNHIQNTLGSDYIVDPEELKGDGRLLAKDRGRATATGQVRLIPPAHFRLELTYDGDEPTCKLLRDDPDTNTPDLILTDANVCVPVGQVN